MSVGTDRTDYSGLNEHLLPAWGTADRDQVLQKALDELNQQHQWAMEVRHLCPASPAIWLCHQTMYAKWLSNAKRRLSSAVGRRRRLSSWPS